MRRRIRVERDHPGRPVASHRFAEKAFGRSDIPSFAQQEVHCSPMFVDRSIETGPAALHLDISLVTSPGTVNWSSVAIPPFFELRNIPLNPAQNRRVSQHNSAFGHHLDQISRAQLN